MKLSVPFRRALAMVVLATSAIAVPVVSSSTTVAAACTWCGGGEFHPLAPTRIFDTRVASPIHDVAPLGAKPLKSGANDTTFDVQVLGLGELPTLPASSGDVLAVAASITVTGPSQSGYLGAYASGSPSVNSILNFLPYQTVPNLAILRPGANGKVTIVLHGDAAGTANVFIDVTGWWSTSGYTAGTPTEGDERGGRLELPGVGLPGRILDTRPTGALGVGSLPVKIRGAKTLGTNLPLVADNPAVTSVLLNITGIANTTTFVSVLPTAPSGMPATSSLNLVAGQTKANLVLVPIGADGYVHIYNNAGNTNILVDVMGVMVNTRAEATKLGRVVPLASPFRVFDTRKAPFGAVPLGPGQAEDWSFANFAGSVNIGGVSVGKQGALLGNLTNASLSRQYPTVKESSYLSACPGVCPLTGGAPSYSNLNSTEAGAVPNMALVPYGANNTVRVYNSRGYAHYILDVSAVVLAD